MRTKEEVEFNAIWFGVMVGLAIALVGLTQIFGK